MHAIVRATGAAVLAGTAGLAYASLIERNWYALRRFTVPVLPAGARPIRVLQISDLHLVPRQERKIAWVRSLAELEPDFVIDTGDNFADVAAAPAILRALEPLLARPGAFVMGSNDYWAPSPKNPARYLTANYAKAPRARHAIPVEDLTDPLIRAGWTDLDNARRVVEVGPDRIPVEFVGVDDPHIERDRYADVAGPRSDAAELMVGVLHAPYQRVLDAMTADGAELVIAGHTHGGQLALPVFGALVTNCDLDRRRAKGLSRWWPGAGAPDEPRAGSGDEPDDAAYLHVSAGLGTSPYAPARFACRPEATLLTLTARDS
ncbi:MAG: metallophosphoesterase [Tetrasphaera sp.]|nr:metallophosphoesterase [Tetrasphaera sp.]